MLPSTRQAALETNPAQADASPREVRAHMVQRLQVGLFGLSFMLLLVGLANIIMDHARRNDAAVASQATSVEANDAGASDPLADIGVVPSPDPDSGKRGNGARGRTAQAQ